MAKPTYQEQIELERFARRHERNLKFLRETPREQRNIPFAEEISFQNPSVGEVAIWVFIIGCIAAFVVWSIYFGEIDVTEIRATPPQASQDGLYAPVQSPPSAVPQAQR